MLKENQKLILLVMLFFAVMGVICLALYKPLMEFIGSPENLKAKLLGWGWIGKLVLALIMGLQVTFAFLPGELIEVMAGVIYGPIEGMFLCLIGAAAGTVLIYIFVDRFGMRFVEKAAGKEKLEKLTFLKHEKKLPFLVFLLFFIPGTPKDLMTYAMPFTPMKLSHFLMISSVARIPSVITSTIAGDNLAQQNILMAAIVFGITGIVSLLGICIYQKIIAIKGKEEKCL